MGRFLVIFVAVGLMVAFTVIVLGARWGGFITSGVAGLMIMLAVRSKWRLT